MANPILAAILSFLVPGLGQAYAGDVKRGIYVFLVAIAFILIVLLFFKEWFYYLVDILISIYVAYDAYDLVKNQ